MLGSYIELGTALTVGEMVVREQPAVLNEVQSSWAAFT